MVVLALDYVFEIKTPILMVGFDVYPCLVLHFSVYGTIISCKL
jgi:hypothetical protein